MISQLIISKNGRLCLSDDSHGPQAVGLNYHRLKDYLKSNGVETIWYLQEGPDLSVSPTQYQGKWWEDEFWTRQA